MARIEKMNVLAVLLMESNLVDACISAPDYNHILKMWGKGVYADTGPLYFY
jgi:hypothetical protein